MNADEIGEAREIDLAPLIADLSGYTAFTETHGAVHASEIVLRFQRLAEASLEPGVAIINSIGDDVFCAGAGTLAVVRTALRLGAKHVIAVDVSFPPEQADLGDPYDAPYQAFSILMRRLALEERATADVEIAP